MFLRSDMYNNLYNIISCVYLSYYISNLNLFSFFLFLSPSYIFCCTICFTSIFFFLFFVRRKERKKQKKQKLVPSREESPQGTLSQARTQSHWDFMNDCQRSPLSAPILARTFTLWFSSWETCCTMQFQSLPMSLLMGMMTLL